MPGFALTVSGELGEGGGVTSSSDPTLWILQLQSPSSSIKQREAPEEKFSFSAVPLSLDAWDPEEGKDL